MVISCNNRKACPSLRAHRRRARAELYDIQAGLCYWCKRACELPVTGQTIQQEDTFTLDHVRGLTDGGTDEPDNYVGACYSCNQIRSRGQHSNQQAMPPQVI